MVILYMCKVKGEINMWNETFFIEFTDDKGVSHREQWDGFELALNRYMSVRKEYQRYSMLNGNGRLVSDN